MHNCLSFLLLEQFTNAFTLDVRVRKNAVICFSVIVSCTVNYNAAQLAASPDKIRAANLSLILYGGVKILLFYFDISGEE